MSGGLDPFQAYLLLGALLLSVSALPAVAVGVYRQPWMIGWGMLVLMFQVVGVVGVILEPGLFNPRRFLMVNGLPMVLATRRYFRHRQFLRACGEYGIYVVGMIAALSVLQTFIR